MLRPFLFFLSIPLLFTSAAQASEPGLTGRVECAGKAGPPVLSYPCPEGSELVFRTEDGTLYRFSSNDPRTAIFADERVRNELLRITAEQEPDGRLAILLLHTVKEGRLYLPHYHCSVCNITAYAPGPCWCCQQEFEFRETPVESKVAGGATP